VISKYSEDSALSNCQRYVA